MASDNHKHTGAKGDGGNELAPERLNVGNGALVVDKGRVGAVMEVQYTGTDTTDKIAVQGASAPRPDFGTGGSFRGGCAGIIARAEERGGTGERIGGEFWAQYGRTTYGIKATTFGSDDPEAAMHIAGFFHADRENNHGEFWAGYFLGRMHVSEDVGIGTTEPSAKLDVNGDIKISGKGGSLIIKNPRVPSSSSDSMGEKGQIAWDKDFIYVKTQAGERNVWMRVELEEW